MKVNLREVRKHKGFTVQHLANATGLTYQYLWRLEKGLHSPSGDTIDKLCIALGVKISDIFVNEVCK